MGSGEKGTSVDFSVCYNVYVLWGGWLYIFIMGVGGVYL